MKRQGEPRPDATSTDGCPQWKKGKTTAEDGGEPRGVVKRRQRKMFKAKRAYAVRHEGTHQSKKKGGEKVGKVKS